MKNYAVLSRRRLLESVWLFIAFLLLHVGPTFKGDAGAAQPRPLRGHVPAGVAALSPIGRVDPARQLRLAIGVPLHNRDALQDLVSDIYNPLSPRYHAYLTPAGFTETFGPSEQEYEAVIAFAQAQGFEVVDLYSNRVVVDVQGSAASIERAFNIHLMQYQHPSESRTLYAPDTEPSVDPLVPIMDVSGLDDFEVPHPLVRKSDLGRPRPLFGSGTSGTYLGKDFRAAYAPNVVVTGAGQTVGLLEFDGYYAADITSYEALTSLPNVPLSNVLLDGYNGNPGSANIEVALDIEMAIAMAPGLSQIIVYQAGPKGFPNDILNRMASDNLAKQLSSSWTWSGGTNATTDSIFLQLAAQGQSFFQASGDSDAYVGSVPQPCDNPYITVVGGTTLSTTGPGGAWASETTWNWANTSTGTNGSSGGISTSYGIPSWQQTVSMGSNQGSVSKRNLPDVALTADNIWVTYNNGSSGIVGGTSAAAPLWAGFAALINQQALANGKSVLGFFNPSLYSLAQSGAYNAAFHDISTGNNTNGSSPNKFLATSGFDLCTGWGTPAGSGLINALAGAPVPVIVSNNVALVVESCTNNAVDPGETVTLSFGLVNTGSANTTNLVATLQPLGGVNAPSSAQSYGALIARGAAVSRPFSFTASGSCGGILTATLQLQDGASNLGTVTFTIRLGAATTVTSFSENFDSAAAPALPAGWTTAVVSGSLGNWGTTSGSADTAPNSVFAADASSAGQTELISPSIPIVSSAAQLTFRHNYNLAFHSIAHPHSVTYYDGGVLEISIGGGAFTDILSAGGSFSAGGYNATLATGTLNPLGGSQAWSGTANGWVTTTVVLPAAAAGHSVQLKWALGTGINTFVGVGWFVDSVSIQDTAFDCCSSAADVGVSQSGAPNPASVGQNVVYTLRITNAGPSMASSLTVTDALPSNVTFVSASPGCINLGNAISCTIPSLGAGGVSNISVTVKPIATGTLTNTVSVTASPADPDSSNNFSLSTIPVDLPPGITTQPTNQVTIVAGSANFYVGATGTAPLTYQWTFAGSALTGATTSALALANVQSSQAGNYAVVVANAVGSVTSSVATLTVLAPPSIATQPTNRTVTVGANTSFLVGATGSAPLSYQWMLNGAQLTGANSSSLVLNNVQTNQAGNYCVIITNSAGSVTSMLATLTVLVPPSITAQPVDQTTTVGSNVTFQASASGSLPLTYQWWFGGGALSGQTASSLALTNVQVNQAGAYQVVVSNAASLATSAVAHLTVLVPPVITSQPTNQAVAIGSYVIFQVSASGSAPLSYQWWFDATNAVVNNTNALVIVNVQLNQAGQYCVVITNAAGSTTSVVATLTVGTPPSILQSPSSLVVLQGQSAAFNVGVNGDAPFTYQWRFNGNAVSGASASTYSVANTTSANAGIYDTIVSNAYGTITSAVAQLTVLIPPTISSQPTNQTVGLGANVAFQVSAAGTAPLTYQWWFDGTNAVGGDTNVLSLLSVQPGQAGNYCVVVTNAAVAVTSAVATLTVGISPAVTQNPSSLVIAQGQSAGFAVAASGTAPLNYQWRYNGTPLGSANSSSLSINLVALAQAGNYDVVVGNAYGSATSSVAQLTVLVPPSFSTQPTNQSVVAGATASFQATAMGSSPLAYQWWFNQTNAVGGDTNVLTISNAQLSHAGNYTLVISNAVGAVTSIVATLTVGIPPAVTQNPVSLMVAQGRDASFGVVVTGDAPLQYQWRVNGTALAGATTSSYTIVGVDPSQAGGYDVLVNNSFGALTSAVALLTVLVPPAILTQPTNSTILAGSTADFVASAIGTGPLIYQWSFNGTVLAGATTNELRLINVQASQSGSYVLVVTNLAGSVTSAAAQLKVLVSPSASAPSLTSSGVSISVSTVLGLNYLLESEKTNYKILRGRLSQPGCREQGE